MELADQRVDFPRESVIEIGGTRFIVTAHFDDQQDALPQKVERLLKKAVCTLDKQNESCVTDREEYIPELKA